MIIKMMATRTVPKATSSSACEERARLYRGWTKHVGRKEKGVQGAGTVVSQAAEVARNERPYSGDVQVTYSPIYIFVDKRWEFHERRKLPYLWFVTDKSDSPARRFYKEKCEETCALTIEKRKEPSHVRVKVIIIEMTPLETRILGNKLKAMTTRTLREWQFKHNATTTYLRESTSNIPVEFITVRPGVSCVTRRETKGFWSTALTQNGLTGRTPCHRLNDLVERVWRKGYSVRKAATVMPFARNYESAMQVPHCSYPTARKSLPADEGDVACDGRTEQICHASAEFDTGRKHNQCNLGDHCVLKKRQGRFIHVMSCHVMSWHGMSCHIMSCVSFPSQTWTVLYIPPVY